MTSFKPTSGLSSRGMQRAADTTAQEAHESPGRETGLTGKGMRRSAGVEEPEVEAAPLDTSQRKSLPKSAFVFPGKAPGPGSYPIHDRAHAANALSRSSGKPEEGAVKRAVCSKFSDLPACKGDD